MLSKLRTELVISHERHAQLRDNMSDALVFARVPQGKWRLFRPADWVFERAIVDDRPHTFLYQDGEGFHFMNPENFDQVVCPPDVVGDMAAYLQEGMVVQLSTHNDIPIALELPRLVTLEIADTEPVVKGQTASGSYKPATLTNGHRIMIPPSITAGTRVVILTEDGSYQERAKD